MPPHYYDISNLQTGNPYHSRLLTTASKLKNTRKLPPKYKTHYLPVFIKQNYTPNGRLQNPRPVQIILSNLNIVGWVDIFTRPIYRDIIIESLAFCQKEKGLVVNSFTIMSNHLHLICYAKEGSVGLSQILADFKRFTANQMLKTIQTIPESRRDWLLVVFAYNGKHKSNNRHYQVWQQDNHPILLVSPKWIHPKINYIHQNAVQAKWVTEAEHYPYARATNYRDGNGLLIVEVIDLGLRIFMYLLGFN